MTLMYSVISQIGVAHYGMVWQGLKNSECNETRRLQGGPPLIFGHSCSPLWVGLYSRMQKQNYIVPDLSNLIQ